MGLDLRLQHKMSQQLVMTPQLQQAIKLLTLSHVEMAQALERELGQNPVLEELDGRDGEASAPGDGSEGDAAAEAMAAHGFDHALGGAAAGEGERLPGGADGQRLDGTGETLRERRGEAELERTRSAVAGAASERGGGTDASDWEARVANASSLSEHLRWQLHMATLSPLERALASYLVEEIDDDGYLAADAVASCGQAFDVPEAQVLRALLVVQDLDPPGVGARNLGECLLFQALAQEDIDPLVLVILREHLPAIEARAFAKLARKLKVELHQVVAAVRRIARLDPHPGRAFGEAAPTYVVPDLYVERAGDDAFEVRINEEGLPRLGIGPSYGAAHIGQLEGAARAYVHDQVRAANWLLRSVQMRQRTMVRVMRSIVQHQHAFFCDGPDALRPMVLRDVAQDVGMHESTISRVTTNKYVHTPHGLFELKFFFNSTLQGRGGDSVASESVRQQIMRLIDREDKNEPLSDQKIVELLRDKDVCIARRTVAKYRKMLNKQPSSVRRRDF